MNSFNIVVHNDKIQNVSETLCYVFDCILADKDMSVLIDESPDLELVQLGKEMFLTFLKKVCERFNYDANRISIEIENLVQSNCWPNIKKCYRSVDVFHAQQIDFNVDKKIQYKTSMFVGGSRWPRLSLASYVYGKYRSDSLITYWQNLKDTTQPCYLYLDDLFKHHMVKGVTTELIDQIKNFIKVLPLHLNESDKQHNKNTGFINYPEAYDLAAVYNGIFCDVICETVHNGQTFAFTEKSARCWMTKTPFLVFGPKHYLANIRKLGFQTFGSFWNENYDNYDNATRIILIQKQIDRIHQLEYPQLEEMYNSTEMQKILDNNEKVFRSLSVDQIRKVFNTV